MRVYSGNPELGGTPLGDSLLITQVAPSSSLETAVVITPTQVGTHTLSLRVDPNNTVSETIESDNDYSYNFDVREIQPNWYMNANVSSSGDGRTPDTAFKTIIEAARVSVFSETILVAAGVYRGGITLQPGVSLKGAGLAHTYIDGTVLVLTRFR